MKNINIGFQRSDKVLEQHNLTELIVLLIKKVNEFYIKNVEGENLNMESALNGIYTLIVFVSETPWLAMQTCLFSDTSTIRA